MNAILASSNVGAPEAAAMVGVIMIALLVGIVLSAIPAILAFVCLNRIPAEHRKQTPGLSFLLMIPLFSLVWAFFVHPKVADSLKSYYAAKGDTTKGDCGANLALWLCICPILCFIPILNIFAGLAWLVLLILFYVKAFELTSGITPSAAQS